MSTYIPPEPNLALLDHHIARIRDGAFNWDQGVWFDPGEAAMDEWGRNPSEVIPVTCGSAFCLAGDVVTQAGGQWVSEHLLLREPADERCSNYDPDVFGVERRARRLLGITPGEGEALFTYNNTLEDIVEVRDEIAARAARGREHDDTGLTG